MKIFTISLVMSLSLSSYAKKDVKAKYRSGKRIDFKSLLIEGEKKKADFSVVTGNLGEEDRGLLKLREDFYPEMKANIKEDIQ